jgi:SAM-dependent methyltransferase
MNFRNRLYGAYVSSKQAGGSYKKNIDAATFYNKSSYYITEVIKKHIPKSIDSKILDLGCGHGDFIYFLKKRGYTSVKGVDISPEQVSIAHSFGLTEVEESDSLNFLNNQTVKFDAVVLFDILEHFTRDELLVFLDLIFEKTSIDGKILIHVPNGEGIYGQRIRYGDLTHELCFTPKSIRQLLFTIGYKKVDVYEDKPLVHGFVSLIRRCLWNFLTLPHKLTLMAETGQTSFILSQNMLVVAQK